MARRVCYGLGAVFLICRAAVAGAPAPAPARPEGPIETAARLAASEAVDDRAKALEMLRGLKGTHHIEKELALWRYGRVALSLRKERSDGLRESRAAFGELAEKASFDFMRWRGEIGAWEVGLAEACDGLAAKKLDEPGFKAKLAGIDDEIDRTLARQNGREYAVNIAHLLGQVREAAGDLPGALKAYRHSLHLLDTMEKRRKILSAAVEDYWGPFDARQLREAVDRVNRLLNAKKEPQLSF